MVYGNTTKVLNEWKWMYEIETKNLNEMNGMYFIESNCLCIVKFDCERGTGWGLKG